MSSTHPLTTGSGAYGSTNHSTLTPSPITITTLVIGPDYTRALEPCLKTKREYAEKQGYTYIQGGKEHWDREKPIAWSKINFLTKVLASLPEGALVWQSDADVAITNSGLRVEDQMLPLLPANKDMLLSLDACGHINSGNILMRNTAWTRDFWRRVGEQTQFTYHIWWENAAMIHLFNTVPNDAAKIEISKEHKKFNAYLRGLPGEPLWTPGDFLVHFAGVYDLGTMADLAARCLAGEIPRLEM
jgi:hypothetical protein